MPPFPHHRLLELALSILSRLVRESIVKVLLLHTIIGTLPNHERHGSGDVARRVANDDADRGAGGVVDDPRRRGPLGDDGRFRVLGEARRAGRLVRAENGKVVRRGSLGPCEGGDTALRKGLLLVNYTSFSVVRGPRSGA